MTFGDRFLSVAAIADTLDFSEETIRRAIRRGELPAAKVAGRLRIDPADLQAWLQMSAVSSAPSPATARAAGAPSTARSGKPPRRATPGERGSFRERARRSREP